MIEGKIIAILQPQNGVSKTGKPWFKQEFVLETTGQYPKKVAFSVMKEDTVRNAQIQIGHVVKIEVDASSREYNGKWYTELNAWRVNNMTVGGQAASSNNVYQQAVPPGYSPIPQGEQTYQQPVNNPSNDDGLPF